jgi:hypothetical protein
MEWLPALTLLGGLMFLGFWLRRRWMPRVSRLSLPINVLLCDGRSASLHIAKRSESGSFIVAGAEYPPSLVQRVDDLTGQHALYYLIGIESVALVQHRELERVRFGILTGALFKPAGDMVELLRLIGAAAVIAVAVFVYLQVASINSALSVQSAELKKANEVLSRPLVVQGVTK